MYYEEEEEDWSEEEDDRNWLDDDWQYKGKQKKSHLQKKSEIY